MSPAVCDPEQTPCSLWAGISPLVQCAHRVSCSAGAPAVPASVVSSFNSKVGEKPISMAGCV